MESNFRVYTETSSELQIRLLSIFTDMVCLRRNWSCSRAQTVRFANMYAANITRDSVRRAFSKGITSKEILNFLQARPRVCGAC